jgi:hypothetical protein
VCAPPRTDVKAATTADKQRAVRAEMVNGQLRGSFRSIERAAEKNMKRMRETQSARCMRLIDPSK